MSDIFKKTGVIGWPIEHSRSPLIHNHWLNQYGREGHYAPIAVVPEDADHFFSVFKESGLIGANVTIPHKQVVMKHLDLLDDAAQAIGAVNTIWLKDGLLHGTNTDWLGFLFNLDAGAKGWDEKASGKPKNALVLGAGGASRGIVYALLNRGFTEIYLANRTLARAEDIKAQFGENIIPIGLKDAKNHISNADIIINTTSLGMGNNPPLDLKLHDSKLECVVTDIVYTPLETPLLKEARKLSRQTVDGLGMLLHQAAPGFKLWYGIKPEVTEDLRALVLKDMGLIS